MPPSLHVQQVPLIMSWKGFSEQQCDTYRSTVVQHRKGSGIGENTSVFVWAHWWVVWSVGLVGWCGAVWVMWEFGGYETICLLKSRVYTEGWKYTVVKKKLGCIWSRFLMESEIRKPNHLKSGQIAAILSKTNWNPDKNLCILNGLVCKWLGLYLWP